VPTYQYACTACDERLEAVQSFSDAPLTECPACGGALRKVFSAVGVVFKGSGFYKTDSRNGAGAKAEGGQSDGSKAESSKAEGSKSEGAKADSGKSDSGKAGSAPSTSAGSSSASSTSKTPTPASKSA
jgi:putative FmdB family regulatory protein